LSGGAYSPHVDHPSRSNDHGSAARRKGASLAPFSKERRKLRTKPSGSILESALGVLSPRRGSRTTYRPVTGRAKPVRCSNSSETDFPELGEFFSRFHAVRFLQRFFHLGSSFFYGSTKTMLR